jgi:hypothetical protein
MDGSIAQALAVTVSGNAFLQGLDIGPFWPEADPFIFCDSVRFVSGDGMSAANPEDWLRQLRCGPARLRLGVVPRNEPGWSDRQTVGFANGGPRWVTESSQSGRGSAWWEPEWKLDREPQLPASDRRIWAVTYRRRSEEFVLPESRPLSVILGELGQALDALADMVERAAPAEAMPGWVGFFRNARNSIDKDDGEHARGDPGPPGFLSAEARRMIHACRAAWAFGGMGAWNDGGYWGSIEAEGDRLSEALFDLLQQGVVAVANSTARPA